MIRVQREIHLLGSKTKRHYVLFAGPRIRCYLAGSDFTSVNTMDLPVPLRRYRSNRAQATVVLRGEYSILRDGKIHTLQPGDLAMEMLGDGRERWDGPNVELFVVEWETDTPVTLTIGKLGAAQLANLRAAVHEITTTAHLTPAQFEPLFRLMDLSNMQQLDMLVHEAFSDPQRRFLAPLAALLGEIFSNLHTNPMWVNFLEKIEMSERHARRHLTTLLTTMGLPPSHLSLRAYLHRVRITHAVGFLRVKGATVSQVAHTLGYGSDRALATALRQSELGSPTALRHSSNELRSYEKNDGVH